MTSQRDKAFEEWAKGKSDLLIRDKNAFHAGWAASREEHNLATCPECDFEFGINDECGCKTDNSIKVPDDCPKCGMQLRLDNRCVMCDFAKEEGGDKRGVVVSPVVVSPAMCPRCGLRQLASALTPEAAGRGLAYRETLTCVQCGYQEVL